MLLCSWREMRRNFLAITTLLLVLLGVISSGGSRAVLAEELCIYEDQAGRFVQVRGREAVPAELATKARCIEEKSRADRVTKHSIIKLPTDDLPLYRQSQTALSDRNYLARPADINLGADARREHFKTPLGSVSVRWARSVEELFGRTPNRAVGDATQAIAKALRSSPFPEQTRWMNVEWNIVFMDSAVPTAQVPAFLVTGCHPGWMNPPADIYIVSERVAAGCGAAKAGGAAGGVQTGISARTTKEVGVADGDLSVLLLHEIGHAVEHRLLTQGLVGDDPLRSEGFATWFESFAAKESNLLTVDEVRAKHFEFARQALARSPDSFIFSGSAQDYGRAALYFYLIERQHGVAGIVKLYAAMGSQRSSFFDGIAAIFGWSRAELDSLVKKLVAAGK